MRNRGSRWHFGLLGLLMTAMLAAPMSGSSPAVQESHLRQPRGKTLHADPTAPAVDIFVDGARTLDDLPYGAQTGWQQFTPGSVWVTITAESAGIDRVIFEAVYPAPADYDYSMIITETLIFGDVFDNSPLPDDSARVRIVHATIAVPAVDVTAAGEDETFAVQIEYPQTSAYLEVPAGQYDFEFAVADTGDLALATPGVNLEGNMAYDVVLMGQPGDDRHPLTLALMSDVTREESTPAP